MRWLVVVALALQFTSTVYGESGDGSPLESCNFGAEPAWSGPDTTLQLNSFWMRSGIAHELSHQWQLESGQQLSYTIPLYGSQEVGLGDVMVNYRYRFAGDDEISYAAAIRVSAVLPTRSSKWGVASYGLQVNVPFSISSASNRIESHTNIGATWLPRRDVAEATLVQSFNFEVTDNLTASLDASYTYGFDGGESLVIRPGISHELELGAVTITPGIAVPFPEKTPMLTLSVAMTR